MYGAPVYRSMHEHRKQKDKGGNSRYYHVSFIINSGSGVTVVEREVEEWLYEVFEKSDHDQADTHHL